jgi:hypothetical protein
VAEPGYAGHHHLALFPGVRLGHRQPDERHGRNSVRQLHRTRPDPAVGADTGADERQLRIFFPKFTGTIYEILSAPLSPLETVTAYVGAAATKSVILALVTLATATLFVHVWVAHPLMMLLFLVAISVGFCLLGFAIGIWAKNFEQLQVIPLLVVTPLTFLGGVFYSIGSIGEPWRTVYLAQPHPLPGRRLSLDLLRRQRCTNLGERGHDGSSHYCTADRDHLDLQVRLSAEIVACWSARLAPWPSRFFATKSQLMIFSSTDFT